MSSMGPTFYADVGKEVVPPDRGIHSRTLSKEEGVELVLFGFAAGESLSEHTSARPAIIHILCGEADLTAGTFAHHAAAGAWLRMPAGTPHSVRARTALVMALYLLPVAPG